MTPPVRHVCVQWPRLGPYHLARLRALHARLAAEGARLTALETGRADTTYAWREERGAELFARVSALGDLAPERTAPAQTRRALTAALDRIDPDAVAITSYSTPDAQAALAWCRHRRRPAVVMFDSRAEDAPRVGWREAVKRVLVGQFDAALVAGTPQVDYLTALGMPPEAVFRPVDVVDNAHFAQGAARARREGALPHPGPYVLSVNRFVARKNVDGLIRAYAGYRQRAEAEGRRPWPLVLLGDGPERDRLAAFAGEGVVFGGFQQADALPAWYAGAGLYVHPALADPWGLVVNEAMAAGLAVAVSTGAGCGPDLVDGNGARFDPRDHGALAALLVRLTGPETDREAMGARSREIIARYTPETFADGLWGAVQAARTRADRPLSLPARAVLGALGLAARRHHAFHTVDA